MIYVVGHTANEPYRRKLSFDELLTRGAFVAGASRERLRKHGVKFDEKGWSSLNLCSPGLAHPIEAWTNARHLMMRLTKGDTLLCFGKESTEAFGVKFHIGQQYWLKNNFGEMILLVSLAHPSGLSRWWNDKLHVMQFEEFIQSLAHGNEHMEGKHVTG